MGGPGDLRTLLRPHLLIACGLLAALACVPAAGPAAADTAAANTGAANTGAANTGAANTGAAGTALPVLWRPVWSDSFYGRAGAGISELRWRYDTGTGGFGTGEIETMTSARSNVALDGRGDLDITALEQGGTWTSGRIQTLDSFAPPAGREMKVTASIMQPDPANGLGYWPAFWMVGPGSWPQTGELDILEDVNGLSQHSGTMHCGNLTQPNGDGTFGPCREYVGLSSGLQPCPGCETGYHAYSIIVDRREAGAEQIRWYLDGQQFFALTEAQVGAAWTQAVDHGLSVVFDLAIGGGYPDAICGCTTPTAQTSPAATMSVRDVAVYDSVLTGPAPAPWGFGW